MRRIALPLLITLLGGCVNAPLAPLPTHLFMDDRFAAPSVPTSSENVFTLNAAMKHFLDTEILGQVRARGPQKALIDALYSKTQLKLEYDASVTRTASEAFGARSGNCLSLVIMTAAFAKALGLDVTYQSVVTNELWSRRGDLYFLNGHVNLTLSQRLNPGSQLLTVDFVPAEYLRGMKTRTISEETVLAMYLGNRAAESLASGRLDDAYWWARAAIGQSTALMSAYNTLGVVYLRQGDLSNAEQVFKYVLEREPQNTRVLANLELLLIREGRALEAAAVHRTLAQIEGDAPFHFFNLGMAAMGAGDLNAARDYLDRELVRFPDDYEIHFWLGVAQLRLGNLTLARQHLTFALDKVSTGSQRDFYAAKLRRIAVESDRR